MSSRDPHQHLPNLTGSEPASTYEDIRSSDPSRFFPSVGKGNVDAVTGRILSVPKLTLIRNGLHNIASGGVFVPIQWDQKVVDTDGMWNASAPTIIKVVTPGRWALNAQILWPFDATSFRELLIEVNGFIEFGTVIEPQQVTIGSQEVNKQIDLKAGDSIRVGAAHNSATNPLTLPGNGTVSRHDHTFQLCLISTIGSDNQ